MSGDPGNLALERAARRGDAARALLDNDLLNESLERLTADYIDAWQKTDARDTDARERLWQAVQIVGKVKNHLVNVVNNGVVARKDINDIARLGERRKFLGVV